MRPVQIRQRGISLIEALVAMAVMAFGTLAVLGVQTSLRVNADISKQRNEAVRIAQATLESTRSYDTVATFDALSTTDPVAVEVYEGANAAYSAEVRVEDAHVYADDDRRQEAFPRRKTVTVIVSWSDRSGQTQSVRLHSVVERLPAAFAASLVVPQDQSAVRLPNGRNAAIPREATTSDDGLTSSFTPPGSSTSWVFDNITGNITQTCTGDVCTAANARLLTGYVRFATETGGDAPNDGDSKTPPGTAVLVNMVYSQTFPVSQSGSNKPCFERLDAGFVTYYCAVSLGTTGTTWSGRSTVDTSSLDITTSLTETSASKYRICRYTTKLGNLSVPTQMLNEEHPNTYSNVRAALFNQNFLVIRAGDGSTAYECPDGDDNIGDPYLNGRTYRHQPTS